VRLFLVINKDCKWIWESKAGYFWCTKLNYNRGYAEKDEMCDRCRYIINKKARIVDLILKNEYI